MLQNIPTHLIAGPLGAGKTSLIRHLLGQRPSNERWAVLINEFGQIGLDAALLSTDDAGVSMGEVAGGCLCCVNGAPFQVGLGRLLRKARPDRLFIEPSGLGHPAELLAQLQLPPWRGVLAVQPSVLVLDAQAMADGAVLPEAQAQALASAGLLVMNKAGTVDERQRLWISSRLPPVPLRWVDHGRIELSELPRAAQAEVDNAPVDNVLPDGKAPVAALWTDLSGPCAVINRLTMAGASAGDFIHSSVSIWSGFGCLSRGWSGGGPRWWYMARKVGVQPMPWPGRRWLGGRVPGARIRGSN
ncbi:hypothetical protein L1887_51791 [Cichorium endivia]|nr:hypothetical protein L1887_51791 [Cichorium endivia]